MAQPLFSLAGPRKRLIFLASIIWIVLIGASLYWNWLRVDRSYRALALESARMALAKDILYRRWAAMEGGVYVAPTEMTPPNPYLAERPDRDVTTSSGRKLTLINPAYMTRQVHELGVSQGGVLGHITSLKPLRPENAPDPWEKKAMEAFAEGVPEIYELSLMRGRPYMRLMRPLVTEEACLKCHAVQGYKRGDIRGGISISVPFAPYAREVRASRLSLALGHVLIGLLGLAGLGFGNRLLRRSEASLQEAAQNWRQTFDALQDAVWLLDMEGRVMRCNKASEQMFNRSCDQITGRHCWEIVHGTAEPIRECPILLMRKTLRREALEIPLGPHWFNIAVDPLLDGEGRLKGVVHVVRDITERKRLEEERLAFMERCNRAEKMEALGTLAGGVAHDMNNILGVITGYSELLQEKIPADNALKPYADHIMASAEKAAAVIQDLLTMARRGVAASDIVNVNKIVADFFHSPMFDRIRAYYPGAKFSSRLSEELLNIRGSAVHLEKTLLNLATNAAESLIGAGEVTIGTENMYLDKPLPGYEEIREGDYVVLIVADTGAGIDASDMGKIFEPFYTKKRMGRSGTGLGLAIVWGTVKDHQGYIDVESKAGEGTTFRLYFPLIREDLPDAAGRTPVEAYQGRGETILVVDDVAEQREVASTILNRLGYRVQTAASGEEALEYLQNHHADLVVLDMIMEPGMDGLETFKGIISFKPAQRVIIVSGFSETERVKAAQALGVGAYVKKPYLKEKIGLAIRGELDRP